MARRAPADAEEDEVAVMARCAECRDGEHDNLTNDVRLVLVRDPDTKRIVRRAWLCSDHISTNLEDGYEVIDQ